MTLVDTNVIVDVLVRDSVWFDWSTERLDECGRNGALFVNEIGYAELSARIDREADVQSALAEIGLTLQRMPTAALFAAGQAFRRYRSASGARPNVLADFFIGAHAQIAQMRILTRDQRRYRNYFPDVTLIAPEMPKR